MPSFDIVSEIDLHEVANAVDQSNREVGQRFDFKGTNAKFELKEAVVTLTAQADFQLKQMLEILRLRLAKRPLGLLMVGLGDVEPVGGRGELEFARRVFGPLAVDDVAKTAAQ